MSIGEAIASGAITSLADSLVFQAPNSLAIEDGVSAAVSTFVGKNFIAGYLNEFIPGGMQHLTTGVAAGLVYAAANQYRQTSPLGTPLGQFLYGFAVAEVTDSVAVPMMSGHSSMGVFGSGLYD